MSSLPSTPLPRRNRRIVIDLTVSPVHFQAIPSQDAALSTSSNEDIVELGKLFDDLRTVGPTVFIRCSNVANTLVIGQSKSQRTNRASISYYLPYKSYIGREECKRGRILC